MAAPTITSISPTSAPSGTPILIYGTNFYEDVNWVKFGSVSCQLAFQVISPTCILATAPDNTGTVAITVSNGDGTSNGVNFTYSAYIGSPGGGGGATGAAPTVTGRNPTQSANNRGQGGDSVTITGTGFTTAYAVYFGGRQAEFTITSDTTIVAISPPGSGTVDISVSNLYGTSSNTANDDFTYPDVPFPTISNLSPNKAYWGRPVVITGTDLDTVVAVWFGSIHAPFYINSPTQITATVPYGGTGTVSVAVENVTGASNTLLFTYAQANTTVPQNPSATAMVDAIQLRWDPVLTLEGVTYNVYMDGNNPPTTLVGNFQASVVIIPSDHSLGLRYLRVSSVDSNGTESAKSTVVSATPLESLASVADRSITQAKLALSIRPPALASSAPTLPDTEYPAGSMYHNTTDHQLYVTKDGSTWVRAVAAADLSGQIVGTQITDDAVTAAKIAANTITAAEIAANTITASQIAANTLTAGEIAAGAIGADELAANSVFAKNIVVADYENLVQNANSELDPTGKDTGVTSNDIEFRGVGTTNPYRGTRCRNIAGAGTATPAYIRIGRPIPCANGDKFVLSAMSRASALQTNYGCRLQIVGQTAALADVDNATCAYPTGGSGTTYGAQSVTYTVTNATVVWVVPVLIYNGAVGSTASFDDLLFRKKMNASLIVDGSITSAMLTIDGSTSFGTGYDPSTKETPAGAQTKADAAQSTAISTASADATSKVNALDAQLGVLARKNAIDAATQITDGVITAAKLGSTIISGGYIATSLLTASNIQTGTLNCSLLTVTNLSAGSIVSGTMSCDRLSGGTISGQTISGGTISLNANGTFQTAASGARIAMGQQSMYDRIFFYHTNGVNYAEITVNDAQIYMCSHNTTVYRAILDLRSGNTAALTNIYASCGTWHWNWDNTMIDYIYPAIDWTSGGDHSNGIWIQERQLAATGRWQIAFYSVAGSRALYVSNGTNAYHFNPDP